ncbi:MAG TPA: response regulator transcription factor [Bryobacteraceae bacterium]|nr:response regulator transcription factor [Bryobacteraceae bacterium]
MPRISVYACESQPVMVEGLRKVLAECDDLEFVGSSVKPAEALDALGRVNADIVLIDLAGGLAPALRLVASLRAVSVKSLPVLWTTDLPESESFRALQIGVRGIVSKSLPASKLVECLREVGKGRIWMHEPQPPIDFLHNRPACLLTPREKQIVALICRGLRNKQIAENLHITAGTVKVHLMHIFEKTGLKDRVALAVRGRELLGAELQSEEPVGR